LLGTAVLCLLPVFTSASPMKPGLQDKLELEDRLPAIVARQLDARTRGYFHIERPEFARPLISPLDGDVDTMRVPVILVDFSDHQYTSFTPAPEAGQFDSVLFSWDKMPYGSMSEFYWENSYGTFFLEGDVVGWYRMPQTYAYYVNAQNGFGTCPRCAPQMVADAVNAADPDLDYSQYDSNNDGWVDGIFVVFAGYGAEETGSDNDIWSHRSSIGGVLKDGVYVSDYSVEPEVRSPGVITDIGVFCHEFGHVLGMPDLYDTDYSSSGVGSWSLMSGGSWNGGGHRPAHFDAWCKQELGFVQPVNILINTPAVEIARAEDSPVAYRLWTLGQTGPEYFLVENRQRYLSDASLPGDGLLIWHIDETRSGNWDENHPLVAVEQADGLFQLEAGGGSDGGDPWPGSSNNREFHDFTTPNSNNYLGNPTGIGIYDISNSGPLMTAELDIVYGRPYLIRDTVTFADVLGNGDGRPDPGENGVELVITVDNLGMDALGLTMTVSTIDPEILFADAVADFGDLLNGQQGSNAADPIIFSVDAGFPPTIVKFELLYSANGGENIIYDTLIADVGPPQVILVDDDNNNPLDYQEYLSGILDSLRTPYTVWTKAAQSSPSPDTLRDYPYTVWLTGNSRSDVLSTADVAALRELLDNGGRLLLTGQDIAEDLANDADSTFLRDYLHVRFAAGSPLILAQGVAGDPISNGHSLPLGGPGGAANQTSPDILVPADPLARVCYTYYNSTDAAGIHVAAQDYKIVFLGFGMEAIADGLPGYTKRAVVFAAIIDWLSAAGPAYTPGDLNGDEFVTPLDVAYAVNYIYRGTAAPPNGVNSVDVNGDCMATPLDVTFLVNFVYLSRGTLIPGCVE
jgi:M6 family metalloprotease-like protein